MPDPIPSTFSRSGQSLFSTKEVRALMKIEFERAARYNYPVCCLLVQVDRLHDVATYHGHEMKDHILTEVVELVRGQTRAGDLLGCLIEDRLLILLPHTSPREVGYMLERLLKSSRQMRFGGSQSITLSIGVAHNQHPDARNFETLERVAEEGVAVATASGGDRYVETELYALHERTAGPTLATAPNLAAIAKFGGDDYRARLVELMSGEGSLETAAASLADEIINRVMSESQADAKAQAEALPQGDPLATTKEETYRKEIENLQRRIAKLTQSLGLTEQEIARLRTMKVGDDGVASLYRDVQGLSPGDTRAELKKDLMSAIFEANMDLKRKSG